MAADQTNLVKTRVASIDALRGFVMFCITGGHGVMTGFIKAADISLLNAILPQFEHVQWEGFQGWDLVMPLFLFIVGVAMPFSFGKRLARGQTKKQLYSHIIKRALILFVLGLVCQANLFEYDLSKVVFHLNTLHAIAAGYVISSIIILNLTLAWQIAVTAGLLLLFWALVTLVPVPGFGAGSLTPEGNLGLFLDRWVLAKIGCMQFCETNLNSMRPLSSITCGANVMLGVFAGHLLRSKKSGKAGVLYLAAIGLALLLAGSLWSNYFPIIKKLWTSSFVLYSCGFCFLLLALFYLVIDVWGFQKWAFVFRVVGTNAIAAYMATQLYDFRSVGNIFVGGLAQRLGPWNNFVQYSAAFFVLWLILYWMYRKKSFIKI